MKKAVFYLFVVTLFFGCSSDNSNSQDNAFVGSWKLTAFVNEATGTTLTASDFENSNEITIDFKEGYRFDGYTVLNEFSGDYSINEPNNLLIFKNLYGSEVGETEWGYLFYDNLGLMYNISTTAWESKFELSDNVLKLYYSENEYMELEKI